MCVCAIYNIWICAPTPLTCQALFFGGFCLLVYLPCSVDFSLSQDTCNWKNCCLGNLAELNKKTKWNPAMKLAPVSSPGWLPWLGRAVFAVPVASLCFSCRCGGCSFPEQTPPWPYDISRGCLLPWHHQWAPADPEGLSVHQEPHRKFVLKVLLEKGQEICVPC